MHLISVDIYIYNLISYLNVLLTYFSTCYRLA